MSSIELTLLAIVLALCFFLVYRVQYRFLSAALDEPGQPGHGFDAGRVVSRIQSLRGDYISALPSLHPSKGYHEELLANARRVVTHFSFFRDRILQEESQPARERL